MRYAVHRCFLLDRLAQPCLISAASSGHGRLQNEGLSGAVEWRLLPATTRFIAGEGDVTLESAVAAVKKQKGELFSALPSSAVARARSCRRLRGGVEE